MRGQVRLPGPIHHILFQGSSGAHNAPTPRLRHNRDGAPTRANGATAGARSSYGRRNRCNPRQGGSADCRRGCHARARSRSARKTRDSVGHTSRTGSHRPTGRGSGSRNHTRSQHRSPFEHRAVDSTIAAASMIIIVAVLMKHLPVIRLPPYVSSHEPAHTIRRIL